MDDASRYATSFVSPSKSTEVLEPIYQTLFKKMGAEGKIDCLRIDMEKAMWSRGMMVMLNEMKIGVEGTGGYTPELNSVVEGKLWRVFKKMSTLLYTAGISGKQIDIQLLPRVWEFSTYVINEQETKANVEKSSPRRVKCALTGTKYRSPFEGYFGELVVIKNNEKKKSDMSLSGELGMIVGLDPRVRGKNGCIGAAIVQKLGDATIIITQHYDRAKEILYAMKQGTYNQDIFDKNFQYMTSEMPLGIRNDNEDEGITVLLPLVPLVPTDTPIYLDEVLIPSENILPRIGPVIDWQESVLADDVDRLEQLEREEDPFEIESVQIPSLAPSSIRNVEPSTRDVLAQERFAVDNIIGRQIPDKTSRSGFQRSESVLDENLLGQEFVAKGKRVDSFIPTKFEDIEKIDDLEEREAWYRAVNKETSDLINNGTLIFVKKEDMNPGIKVIRSKLVFAKKTDAEGNEKEKARFVCCEIAKLADHSLQETYAPVVSLPTLLALLSTTLYGKHIYRHWDVSAAFTSTPVPKDTIIYVNIFSFPNEHLCPHDEGVFQLGNLLYGLCIAAKEFEERLARFWISQGFGRNPIDPSLFSKVYPDLSRVNVAIYVDDIFPVGPPQHVAEVKIEFAKRYLFRDVTDERKIIGMEVEKDTSGSISFHQSQYIKELASTFEIKDKRRLPLPFKYTWKLDPEELVKVDQTRYLRLVGSLLYVSRTRPDIILYLAYLCENMKSPNVHNLKIAVSLIEYLMGTIHSKLTFSRQEGYYVNRLIGFGDGGGVAACENGKSRICHGVWFNGAFIYIKSKTTDWVEDNMMSIEFIASYYAYKEIRSLKGLLESIIPQEGPMLVLNDNQSAIYAAHKPHQTKKSRYINIVYFGLREALDEELIILDYCPSDSMPVDIGTKLFGETKFTILRNLVLGSTHWPILFEDYLHREGKEGY